ncbi:hypothetical protein [Burkholderia ambifaria]|uniref:hypothetical protein n=1 Tax=Burkholderia ambifaria TaxID=152480 RepID=UPI001ABBA9A6|nr:hypothetical protein [Burkholderia ambifaria]
MLTTNIKDRTAQYLHHRTVSRQRLDPTEQARAAAAAPRFQRSSSAASLPF